LKLSTGKHRSKKKTWSGKVEIVGELQSDEGTARIRGDWSFRQEKTKKGERRKVEKALNSSIRGLRAGKECNIISYEWEPENVGRCGIGRGRRKG